jgi:RNA polymerase sigma factor (sigma-70 family)
MTSLQLPATRLTLIGAIRQGLRWEEFVALYGRLILHWGRRDFGLQECDAENLRQEVLIRVWRGVKGYDPSKGRFRNWLYACTRNAVSTLRRGECRPHSDCGVPPGPTSPGGEYAAAASIDEALRALDEEGFAPEGFQEAVLAVRSRVHPTTWKAFLLFDLFDLTAREVAAHVSLKPAGVNQAVFRVRQLLRQALAADSTGKRP